MIDALVDNAKYLWGPCTERTMNIEVDPEQMNKTCWISQTNEQHACSVFVCSLPTLPERVVESFQIFVVESLGYTVDVHASDLLLLFKQIYLDIASRRKTKQNPTDSGRRAVMVNHEQNNHHVSNLAIGYWRPIFI